MKISCLAISILGLGASVSAFTAPSAFGSPRHALRMAKNDKEDVGDNSLVDFKSKQSVTRIGDKKKVSLLQLNLSNISIYRF